MLGRAVGAGGRRRRARLRRPARNLLGAFHCLELARRDGAQFVFLSTSRVYPVAALAGSRLRRGRDALRARGRAVAGRRLPSRHRRGLPARRRANALRRDEARRRSSWSRSTRRLRPARGRQPLRRHRRPVADGQGRPGRVHATGCSPTTSGGRCATSASAAPASRCATCCTSTTWSS